MRTMICGVVAGVLLTAWNTPLAVDGKHVNGFAVSTSFDYPLYNEIKWNQERYPRGKIVRYDIANGAVTGSKVLFDGVGQYPAINLSGTRIVFFRWGLQIAPGWGSEVGVGEPRHLVAGSESNPNYLSVVNKDGSGLTNLIQVSKPGSNAGCGSYEAMEGNALLDWPSGDWIYYIKPTGTAEVWRVNVNDPSHNEKIMTYTGGTPPMRRWALSADAKYSGQQVLCGGTSVPHNGACDFPGNSPSSGIDDPGCNATVSPSGNFIVHYLYAGHSQALLHKWDHKAGWVNGDVNNPLDASGFSELASWSGQECGGWAEVIRFSANSDKWYCREIGWCGSYNYFMQGGNSWCVNWVDKAAIRTSNNPKPDCNADYYAGYGKSNCAGDLWVAGGPANSYEDVNGQWQYVAPIDPLSTSSAASIKQREHHAAGMSLKVAGAFAPAARAHMPVAYDLCGRRTFALPKNALAVMVVLPSGKQ